MNHESHERDESRERVSCLARLFASFVFQDATQAELDALLPAVLDRAFRGEP